MCKCENKIKVQDMRAVVNIMKCEHDIVSYDKIVKINASICYEGLYASVKGRTEGS